MSSLTHSLLEIKEGGLNSKKMISVLKLELENRPDSFEFLKKSGIFNPEELSKTTLHRWINGTSCPTVYKQLKIAHLLFSDYRYILRDESIDGLIGGRALSKVINDYFKVIDDSNLLGGYSKIIGEVHSVKRTVSCAEYHQNYYDFLVKMPSYMSLREHQLNSGLSLDFDVDLIEIFDGETLVGHIAYTKTKEKYLKKIKVSTQFDNSLFIFPMYYSTSDILMKILSQFYLDDFVSKYIFGKRKILMMVRDYRTLVFLEKAFGCVVESLIRGGSLSSTMYIVSIDPLEVLSSVDILKEVRKEFLLG